MSVTQVGSADDRMKGVVCRWGEKHLARYGEVLLGKSLLTECECCKTFDDVIVLLEGRIRKCHLEKELVARTVQLGLESVKRGDGLPHLNLLIETVRMAREETKDVREDNTKRE